MNNTNSQEYRSALKKAISAANQALELHYALDSLSAQDYESASDLINNVFKKRMNILAVSSSGTRQRMARASAPPSFIDGYIIGDPSDFHCEPYASDDETNFFITQDGTIFCIDNWYNGEWSQNLKEYQRPCNIFNSVPCRMSEAYPNLWIDVNGVRKPNKATKKASQPRDQYTALIYNTKVVPFDEATQEIMYDKQVSTDSQE